MLTDATTDPVGSEREESDSEEEDDHSPTPTVSAGLQNVGELRKIKTAAQQDESVFINFHIFIISVVRENVRTYFNIVKILSTTCKQQHLKCPLTKCLSPRKVYVE
ncbi:hypothetical protein NQ318_016945 [Aromia moschata]|uniref:Uncharacterized protein n=1 Tax=Aromia moschata TaxID=1265417 RepID=A0AAV8XQR5_9CUCU|nr:hypothetical protein NQ318_016945 [Aromia moschata]